MMVLLPILFFILAVILFKKTWASPSWRLAVVLACLLLGVSVFFLTEILSIWHAFAWWPLVIGWASLVIGMTGLVYRVGWDASRIFFFKGPALSKVEQWMVVVLIGLALSLGIIALWVPPNTWDAMTYHLSRVAHWIQNKSVMFYPTHIERQLYMNPLAEYGIAQVQILLGGDRLANCIQYASMLGSLVGVSLIAQELGLNRAGQLLSALLAITLPNALVEATSTQTDFVATLWVVMAVYFILKSMRQVQAVDTVAAAAAIGLSLLTKAGETLFIIVPFLAWMAWTLKKQAPAGAWRHWAAMAAITVLAVGLPLWRNYYYLGSCFFSGDTGHVLSPFDVRGVISNVLLHAGMHLRVGIVAIDNGLGTVIETIHRWMGMTVLTSPANVTGSVFNYVDFPFYEDEVPNFIFTVAYIGCLAVFLKQGKRAWESLWGKYVVVSFLALFMFNVLIKWSPFDGRYHLPFFVLLAPVVAAVALKQGKLWLMAGIGVLALVSVVLILFNSSKPFFSGPIKLFYKKEAVFGGRSILKASRVEQYFYNRPGIMGPLVLTAQSILSSGCTDIGLHFDEGMWEYPFWVIFAQSRKPFRIEHVLVKGASASLPYPNGPFQPCLIISRESPSIMAYGGQYYVLVKSLADYNIFAMTRSR